MQEISTLIRDRLSYLLDLNETVAGKHPSYEQTSSVVFEVASNFGTEGLSILLQALLQHSEGNSLVNSEKVELLSRIFGELSVNPAFPSVASLVFSAVGNYGDLLEVLSLLRLNSSEFVAVGLSLISTGIQILKESGKTFVASGVKTIQSSGSDFPLSIASQFLFTWNSSTFLQDIDIEPFLNSFPEESRSLLLPFAKGVNRQPTPVAVDLAIMAAKLKEKVHLDAFIEEKGHRCTANVKTCLEVLSQFPAITESEICRLVCMVAKNSSFEGHQKDVTPHSWNIEILVEALKKRVPRANWTTVVQYLDNEVLFVPEMAAFSALIRLFSSLSPEPFPVSAVCGKLFSNLAGQFSFLKFAVNAPPEVFSFAVSPHTIAPVEGLHSHKSPIGTPNRAWLSLDFVETLCRLAETSFTEDVFAIVENAVKVCPEIVTIALSKVKTDHDEVQTRFLRQLLPIYIGTNPNSSTVLHAVWPANKAAVMEAMVGMHSTDASQLGRILDICQEMKVLSTVLENTRFGFSIELAALAARREYLNVEKWIQDMVTVRGDEFFKAFLSFLKEKVVDVTTAEGPLKSSVNLPPETIALIFQVLYATRAKVPSKELISELKSLWSAAISLNPPLLSTAVAELAALVNFPEVEDEANAVLERLYKDEIQMQDFLDLVRRYRKSTVERERMIYYCLVHDLYDEQKKHLSEYAEEITVKTARLFGSLIQNGVLPKITRYFWLSAVTEHVKAVTDEKRFLFGVLAFDQLRFPVLSEIPIATLWFIVHIPQVQAKIPDHVKYITTYLRQQVAAGSLPEGSLPANQIAQSAAPVEEAAEGSKAAQAAVAVSEEFLVAQTEDLTVAIGNLEIGQTSAAEVKAEPAPLDAKAGAPALLSATETKEAESAPMSPTKLQANLKPIKTRVTENQMTGFGQNVNTRALEAAAEKRSSLILQPPEKVKDTMTMIINNLTADNMDDKVKLVREVLKEEHYPWFAEYMVIVRVVKEPNLLVQYLSFLDKLGSKSLFQEVLKQTYQNCNTLLESTSMLLDSNYRSLLRNLGCWLGKLTVGRNQPIRAKEIDPKQLIITAYEKGTLIAIIPFTSKILESCVGSVAFKPPSPWTMGILKLYAELLSDKKLKMAISFDMENTFKAFNLPVKDVVPSQLLKVRQRVIEGNPDFQPETKVEPSEPPPLIRESQIVDFMSFDVETIQEPGPLFNGFKITENIPNFDARRIPQNQTIYSNAKGALEYAVKHVCRTVFLRVQFVIPTAINITMKDLILDPDEEKIFRNAIRMCRALGSVHACLVVNEIFSVHTFSNVFANGVMLEVNQQLNFPDQTLMSIQAFCSDNLEVFAHIIVTTVLERLFSVLTESLAVALKQRVKKKETVQNYNEIMHGNQIFGKVPEFMRPNARYLMSALPVVYDAYDHIHNSLFIYKGSLNYSRFTNQIPVSMTSSMAESSSKAMAGLEIYSWTDKQLYLSPTIIALLSKVEDRLGNALSYTDFPASVKHIIQLLRLEIEDFISNFTPAEKEEFFLAFVKHAFHRFWQTPTLGYYVLAFDMLKTKQTMKELTTCVMAVEDLRLFNVDAAMSLLRNNIILNGEYIHHVAKLLEESRHATEVVQYARALVTQIKKEVLFPAASLMPILNNLPAIDQPNPDPTKSKLQNDVEILFNFWTTNFRSDNLHQLTAKTAELGYYDNEDLFKLFVGEILNYIPYLVKQFSDKTDANNVYNFAAKTVFFITRGFAQKHSSASVINRIMDLFASHVFILSRDPDFAPRMYFQIFLTWFDCFLSPASELHHFSTSILESVTAALFALRPTFVPNFCFAWFELITHPKFMPKLLFPGPGEPHGGRKWQLLLDLLLAHLKFLRPFIANEVVPEPVELLLLATTRAFSVLLHDEPSFFSHYYVDLCSAIPWNCVQLRSIVLSAFPRLAVPISMKNPLNERVQIESDPDFQIMPPKVFSDVETPLDQLNLLRDLRNFLESGEPASFLGQKLVQSLILSVEEAGDMGTKFNVPALNCITHIAIHSILPKEKWVSRNPCQEGPAVDMFVFLLSHFDAEGRYMLINAIVNQLRYKNKATFCTAHILLHFFSNFPTSDIKAMVQEQITRVLTERLVACSPYQWGVVLLMMELWRNEKYDLKNQAFVKNHADIAQTVSNVCGATKSDN